jgi:uncharacterized protein (TIGR00730 family)
MKKQKNTRKTLDVDLHKIDRSIFRVSIFGSARVKPNDEVYKMTVELAKKLAAEGCDIVTGGGPGLMEAANKGHEEGRAKTKNKLSSIGLTIALPHEQKDNKHLDLHKNFQHFSNRLDYFMTLSNAVVIMPGGVGTCLEFFYSWQLLQVQHICPMPIILYGEMWGKLFDWVIDYPVRLGYLDGKEAKHLFYAKDEERVMTILKNAQSAFKLEGASYCSNLDKYRLDA